VTSIGRHLTSLQDLSLRFADGLRTVRHEHVMALRSLPLRALLVDHVLTPALAEFADAGMPLTDLSVDMKIADSDAAVLSRFSALRTLCLRGWASVNWISAAPASLTELMMYHHPRISGFSLAHLPALRRVRSSDFFSRDLDWLVAAKAPALDSLLLAGSGQLHARNDPTLLTSLRLTELEIRIAPQWLGECTTLTSLQVGTSEASVFESVAQLPRLHTLRLLELRDAAWLAPLKAQTSLRRLEVMAAPERIGDRFGQSLRQRALAGVEAARGVLSAVEVRLGPLDRETDMRS
jgi:hypothetical protein